MFTPLNPETTKQRLALKDAELVNVEQTITHLTMDEYHYDSLVFNIYTNVLVI